MQLNSFFRTKKTEERKKWRWQFQPGTYLDQKEKLIKYSDLVNVTCALG